MSVKNIAYFVTPHGFGHATRAAAVMEAILSIDPETQFHVFSTVPTWLFQETLDREIGFQEILVDIGLAQKNSLEEDLDQTIQRLDKLLPYSTSLIDDLANQLTRQSCQLVICDIAPLGIAVAQAANIPSLLIENFTWDWIYEGYLESLNQQLQPKLNSHSGYLKKWFSQADYHVQTSPICNPSRSAHLKTHPISRKRKSETAEIRDRMKIPADAKLVLITMGGIPWDFDFLTQLECPPDTLFLIPGGSDQIIRQNNLLTLPHQSGYYHPDLINAADAVIGKVGYSTIAEVYQAGVPFGYISRPQFKESKYLVQFIQQQMQGVPIKEELLAAGNLQIELQKLLQLPQINRHKTNGADEVARYIVDQVLNTRP